MSAKSSEPSTSAPPWCLIGTFWHVLQIFGLPSAGAFPMSRIRGPPTPPNGGAEPIAWARGGAAEDVATERLHPIGVREVIAPEIPRCEGHPACSKSSTHRPSHGHLGIVAPGATAPSAT